MNRLNRLYAEQMARPWPTFAEFRDSRPELDSLPRDEQLEAWYLWINFRKTAERNERLALRFPEQVAQ